MWILSLLLFFLILGLLVTIHEFGHFIIAKKCQVHIYEFSIGMGPLLWKHMGKDKIQYSIRALPIGGYVQMAGEVGEDDPKVKKDKFLCNRPWWQRILVLCAGVFNNFVLALILLFVSGLIWGGSSTEPKIAKIEENSAMALAGAKDGDVILSVNGKKAKTWDKIQLYLLMEDEDNKYNIEVKHISGEIENIEVSPEINSENSTKTYGIKMDIKKEYGFKNAVKYAINKFRSVYESMFTVITGLFTGKFSIKSLSGPVGIYSVVDQSAKLGLEQVIYLTAFLSINLGFVNLLPFPAFDGGHVLFVIIEMIKGSKVDPKLEGIFHTIGFALIFLLMIIITIQDIIRLL